MWDVIIVGARCAGAATALRFARSGRSVLVLDRAPLGSDTLSTHILIPPALMQLESMGLLERVRATGAPLVRQTLFEFAGNAYARPILDPPGYQFSIRRTTLDPILVEAARTAGATVRHGAHVEALVWEDDRVVGVRGRDAAGSPFEERARLVVGADGRHSLVARLVEAPEYNAIECLTGAFYAYYEGIGPSSVGDDVLQVAFGPQALALCCPCDGDLHVILMAIGREEFDGMRASDTEAFEARVRTIPSLAPRLGRARRVGKLHPAGPSELRGYFRRPFGPGWALVGDAGECPHPAGAHGIADALRSAELLHESVEAAWADGQLAEAQLEKYQRARDGENTGPYYFSFRMARVDPWRDPEVAGMLAGQVRPPMQAVPAG